MGDTEELSWELMLTSKIDVDEARIAGGCLLRLKEGAVLHALKQASQNITFLRLNRTGFVRGLVT